MKQSKEIPGFLPEDYDYIPSIEDMELNENELRWLRRSQKEAEDGKALGDHMAATYDSYLVIGFNSEQKDKNGRRIPESVCGAYKIDPEDYDAISEMGKILGHYLFQNFGMYKVVKRALSWEQSLREEDNNPDPPEHDSLELHQRFHIKRYRRIHDEEYQKVRQEFIAALGNGKKRHDIAMRLMLTALADQLNENDDAEVDFFCNFEFGENSEGDNVSGIDIWPREYPCSWDEADAKMGRLKELCREYNVPCHFTWLED